MFFRSLQILLLIVVAAACLLSGSVPAREMFAIQVKCTHGVFCDKSTVTLVQFSAEKLSGTDVMTLVPQTKTTIINEQYQYIGAGNNNGTYVAIVSTATASEVFIYKQEGGSHKFSTGGSTLGTTAMVMDGEDVFILQGSTVSQLSLSTQKTTPIGKFNVKPDLHASPVLAVFGNQIYGAVYNLRVDQLWFATMDAQSGAVTLSTDSVAYYTGSSTGYEPMGMWANEGSGEQGFFSIMDTLLGPLGYWVDAQTGNITNVLGFEQIAGMTSPVVASPFTYDPINHLAYLPLDPSTSSDSSDGYQMQIWDVTTKKDVGPDTAFDFENAFDWSSFALAKSN